MGVHVTWSMVEAMARVGSSQWTLYDAGRWPQSRESLLTPDLRIRLLAFIERIKAMPQSNAHCSCGRFYRLTFDLDMTKELALLEGLIEAEPVPGRFTYVEYE